ncbi:conserved Plasmodium protein, unknown function [Plasmodium ovale wallikeri]|uniref:Uncharacterized protein n=2 Tax=Plasmodium ovale TaxID=36330 RepID=A0A1C3L4V5_PLAOA|nr:conserved Plasmodium protein, unknown function [Plasmodium ovale wallikeri]SBT82372.1 conserved Plasmodium protein, unknown function [Plasmodium ovale]
MNTANSNEKKNLLIYDKSTKIGCIYFIGISSNIYRGKIILKKNSISDKIVRYTNLNDNLMLIINGNYNFKQTAILIKGITIFLHRQLEVLLTDYYSMYKKCLFGSLNAHNGLNGVLKKYKANKRFKAKKNILCLQDVANKTTNDTFINNTRNNLNTNKNIANINDIMLKENSGIYNNDYNFGIDDINNDENFMYQDMLTHSSSFEYSKLNNFYTINNDMTQNLNTKGSTCEVKLQRNVNNTLLNLGLMNQKKNKNIDKNNYSSGSLFTSKNLDRKNISFSVMRNSLLMHDNAGNGNTKDNYENANGNTRGNGNNGNGNNGNGGNRNINKGKNKRTFAHIDQEIILKDTIWKDLKMNKKKKSDNTLFDNHLDNVNCFLYFINNNIKKNSSKHDVPSFNFYEQAKHYISIDARKELYITFDERLVQNAKCNMQPNNYNLIQTKSTLSSLSENKERGMDDMGFELLREKFSDDYFMNMELRNSQNENKYSKNSENFFINCSDHIDYNFDRMSYSQNKGLEQKKLNSHELYIHNKSSGDKKNHSSLSFQNDNYNNTLSDTFKDSVSVPSSKLVKRRSFTSSQYKYDIELLKLKSYLYKLNTKNVNMEFEHIFPLRKMSDKNISLIFYNLLVLASNGEIELNQNFPNKNILIQVCAK